MMRCGLCGHVKQQLRLQCSMQMKDGKERGVPDKDGTWNLETWGNM